MTLSCLLLSNVECFSALVVFKETMNVIILPFKLQNLNIKTKINEKYFSPFCTGVSYWSRKQQFSKMGSCYLIDMEFEAMSHESLSKLVMATTCPLDPLQATLYKDLWPVFGPTMLNIGNITVSCYCPHKL